MNLFDDPENTDFAENSVKAVLYLAKNSDEYSDCIVFYGYPNVSDNVDPDINKYDIHELIISVRSWLEHWDCGDGCCSDSWFNGELKVESNGNQIYSNDYDEVRVSSDIVVERLLDRLKDSIWTLRFNLKERKNSP